MSTNIFELIAMYRQAERDLDDACRIVDGLRNADPATLEIAKQDQLRLKKQWNRLERETLLCPVSSLSDFAAKARFIAESNVYDEPGPENDPMLMDPEELGYWVMMRDVEQLAGIKPQPLRPHVEADTVEEPAEAEEAAPKGRFYLAGLYWKLFKIRLRKRWLYLTLDCDDFFCIAASWIACKKAFLRVQWCLFRVWIERLGRCCKDALE